MKFIHSSDLQIGKAFGTFSTDVATMLQEARQAALRVLGDAAMTAGASAVLVAGDVFEREQMSQATLIRAVETMRAESVRLTVCASSMAGCSQRIVVGKRSAKKMTNWA